MKLIFVSNYFNHHQLPFCDALYELLEGDFCFLQTQPMEEERVKMGWQAEERPYVSYAAKNSCAHKSGVEKMPGSESNSNAVTDAEEFEKLLFTADVVIFGGCDEESYIQERLTAGKPIFRYNERLYKEGQWKAVSPRGLLQKYKDHTRYRKAPVYFLCAGAYVPCDYHLIHAYPGKMLRFGYFPETRHYEAGQPFNHKEPGSILWAARMIDWKHPELVVKTASYLKELLEEIERAFEKLDGVSRCCCLFDKKRNKLLGFYTGDSEEKEVHQELKRYLPVYMIPAKIRKIDKMPLNKNGKIDRKYLAEEWS